MRINYYVLLIGIVLLGCNTSTVSYRPESRNIIVTTDSVKYYADISLKPYKGKLKNTLLYHWYSSDKFGANYGGFNGYLLNGNFKKVNFKGNLLEQGLFSLGLKDGIWKYWYTNGNLKHVENWKKGLLSTPSAEYSVDGVLISPPSNSLSTANQIQVDSTTTKAPWYKRLFKKDKKSTK